MVTALRPALAVLVLTAAACSSGDGTDIGASPSSPTLSPDSVSTPAESPAELPGVITPPDLTPDTVGDEVAASSSTDAQPTFPTVPETGIPGLDSDDEFCAAWSRFGGSFQVVAVNAAFGDGSVVDRAFVEVAGGPTVALALDDMAAAWPDEIATEAGTALGDVFGPFATRVGAAEQALTSAGATSDDIEALTDAWLAFLAVRDPSEVAVVLDLDDRLTGLVVAAVPTYLTDVGTWDEDESLVTEASIPMTEAYLAARCPDQGTLAGQEVG